jgi:hypothetical protein
MKPLARLLAVIGLLWAHAALASPAIDGIAPFNACGAGSPLVISTTLTTTNTHDAIIVMVTFGATPGWVNTVTDTAGLTFTRRAQVQATSITTDKWEEWYAPAAATLTGDTITVTTTTSGGSNCIKIMAVGISGANWPVPFDPLYGYPFTTNTATSTPQTFTTLGTDDLLLAHYGQNGCTGPLPGAGWTALYQISGSDLLEYKTVSGAQTGLQATVGNCAGNMQTFWGDAFVSAAGLGIIEQSSKLNSYAVLQTGMGSSKDILYVIVEPGIGNSKDNLYVITIPSGTPPTPGGRAVLPHIFPP